MPDAPPKIFSLGDSALTVEFGNSISPRLNQKAISLAVHFEKNKFPGFIEAVPAYASVTLFYDLVAVKSSFAQFPTAFDAVGEIVSAALKLPDTATDKNSTIIEIPVHFDASSALDLDFVAKANSISANEIIEIFTCRTYRVYMLGFLPGFTYMGEVDERIATPRRDSPRESVPKGSVGIAGSQTGIYSLDSPGGWQIIGRTDIEMFRPKEDRLTYLQAGDLVKFVAVK